MQLNCPHGFARNAFLLVMTSAVSGCASSVESVFSHQNRTAAALATMAIEAEAHNPRKLDTIYAAETQLHDACAPLRNVAARRINGNTVGIGSELMAIFSLDRCATETDQLENFIWLEAPPIARLYLGPAPGLQLNQ
jgi:hypothetical protein